jgi:hypothetical protein
MDGMVIPVPQVETEERCDVMRCQPVDENEDLDDLGILERELWPVYSEINRSLGLSGWNIVRVGVSENSSERTSGG